MVETIRLSLLAMRAALVKDETYYLNRLTMFTLVFQLLLLPVGAVLLYLGSNHFHSLETVLFLSLLCSVLPARLISRAKIAEIKDMLILDPAANYLPTSGERLLGIDTSRVARELLGNLNLAVSACLLPGAFSWPSFMVAAGAALGCFLYLKALLSINRESEFIQDSFRVALIIIVLPYLEVEARVAILYAASFCLFSLAYITSKNELNNARQPRQKAFHWLEPVSFLINQLIWMLHCIYLIVSGSVWLGILNTFICSAQLYFAIFWLCLLIKRARNGG